MPSSTAIAEAELDKSVQAAARKLAPDVEWIRYAVTWDSTGDRAIFFRIVLSDDAARTARLAKVAKRVRSVLAGEVKPSEAGLLYYDASKKILSESFAGQNPQDVSHLKAVAEAFFQLQEFRHKADYDTSFELTRADAESQIALAADAFKSWKIIHKEPVAHDYLLALLVPDKRRQIVP